MRTLSALLAVAVVTACGGSVAESDSTAAGADLVSGADLAAVDLDVGLDGPPAASDLAAEGLTCLPACDERTCGPDGCGGSCGHCESPQVCLDFNCCTPDCGGRDCGPDGCGGKCGQCIEEAVCLDGRCCEPACQEHDCGPDGCGGSCGQCAPGRFCMNGLCSAPDADFDGVPDHQDLFPQDSSLPGTVKAMTVYAQTATALYAMDVKLYKLDKVGDFGWPEDGATHKMTDIGIDSYGVLYGTSYEYLYTCHPETVQCSLVAKLPGAFNGLTMVPAGLIEPDRDVMVAISEKGEWYRLDLEKGTLQPTKLGSYGPLYKSAGDAYSIAGIGTFAAVHKTGADSNVLVTVDPANGEVIKEIGPISGYVGIFGLAGWTDKAFAFDKTGDVLLINTADASIKLLHETEIGWWGAGVKSKLD